MTEEGSPTSRDRSPINPDDDAEASTFDTTESHEPYDETLDGEAPDDDDDGFGDFDEFEEGGDGDDFGDFDDGFQQGEQEAETSFDSPPDQPPVPVPSPGPVSCSNSSPTMNLPLPHAAVRHPLTMTDHTQPVLDFDQLHSLHDIISATQPYMDEIYPTPQDIPNISTTTDEIPRSIFLSERSQSLWTQLVAPPPLQPPDWVRSRIRRLFLVSLGVPVDLDEILPASKQKKLILPSIHIPGDRSPRPSSDGRLARVKRDGDNTSTTSLDSSASKQQHQPDRKRKGPPPPPELDLSATGRLCATTEAALRNLTEAELKEHVERLEGLKGRAQEVFEYWQKRMESALGDKDAFEQVIESLVAHAKKLR